MSSPDCLLNLPKQDDSKTTFFCSQSSSSVIIISETDSSSSSYSKENDPETNQPTERERYEYVYILCLPTITQTYDDAREFAKFQEMTTLKKGSSSCKLRSKYETAAAQIRRCNNPKSKAEEHARPWVCCVFRLVSISVHCAPTNVTRVKFVKLHYHYRTLPQPVMRWGKKWMGLEEGRNREEPTRNTMPTSTTSYLL